MTSSAIIKARPSLYAKWLVKAFPIAVILVLTDQYVLNLLALLLVLLLVIWHALYVLQRLRSGPVTGGKSKPAGDYSLELNALLLIAVSFALSKILLVILVEAPLTRYMDAAGVFLPTVVVVALFVLGGKICALLAIPRQ